MTRRNFNFDPKAKEIKSTKECTNVGTIKQLFMCDWKFITLILSLMVVLYSRNAHNSLIPSIFLKETFNLSEGGWISDKLFELVSKDVPCDILILNYDEINWNTLNKVDLMTTPFIIKGTSRFI